MKISKITIILLVVALAAGAAAAYGAQNYIQKTVLAYQANLESRYEGVKVVVAAGDLPAGTALDGSNVLAREVPKEFLHKDVIFAKEWKSFNGRTARHQLTRGAPVLRSHLLGPRGGRFAQLIEAGKRALTVPVDQISSVSGMVAPGDRVDFLLTLRKRDKSATIPLMKDVNILATGVRTDIAQGERPYTTVTILATPEEAGKMIHSRELGTLTAVLRSTGDESDDWPVEITQASILGEEPVPEVKKRKSVPLRLVQVILGGKGEKRE